MTRVFLVSPLRGDYVGNTHYARDCMRDSIKRGEAPYVPHLLYPQVLDDTLVEERRMGMNAGAAWLRASEKLVVYEDLGTSEGMRAEIEVAEALGIPVERRSIR